MKKNILLFLVLINLFFVHIVNTFALENSDIFSNEAIVYNLNTDEVLFSKNTNDGSVQIASLTKIMTYVLAVENIADLENTKIVVPDGIKASIAAQGGSNTGLEDGYEYSVIDLLYGLMLPSGCDAADVFALHISGNDYSKFIDMMNDKAKELGMNDTIFYSATGLEIDGNNNLSTEQDLYKLAKYALKLPYFKKIISTEFYDVTGVKGENVDSNMVRNTNYMVGEYNGAEYFYQYSLGGKTGNLSGAGRCLISFATKGDLELVAITLGVPNEHSNYHLTDHRKLFDYSFDTFTENILIDIGSLYKSVGIGKKIQINPITTDTNIKWTSSDESIATVNEYGVVTGKKLGQVKIVATTSTGNQDYAYVSVGFYNGIDIKYSAGPTDPNGILNYGKLDWSIVKEHGIDFAIIRAGYALNNNPDSDPYFVTNIEGAIKNDINILISFDGYASDGSYALKEAEYLINYLNENIPEYLDKINLPIVYNLYTSSISDVSRLNEIIVAFTNKMKDAGYEVIVELSRTMFSKIDLFNLITDIDLYMVYRPYVPDYQTRMHTINNDVRYDADLWQYRSDAYFGDTGIAKNIIMSAMYMDYKEVDTSHENHDDNLYSEKPNVSLEKEYVYTGENIEALVNGFDKSTMEITGNIQKDVGVYTITITPKIKWKDGSKTPITIKWEIKKANPIIEVPKISAHRGMKLKDIKLPDNFYWKNPEEVLSSNKNSFYVTYIPLDNNYNSIDILITIDLVVEKNNIINKVNKLELEEVNDNLEKEELIENIEKEDIIETKKEENNVSDVVNKKINNKFIIPIIIVCSLVCALIIKFKKIDSI